MPRNQSALAAAILASAMGCGATPSTTITPPTTPVTADKATASPEPTKTPLPHTAAPEKTPSSVPADAAPPPTDQVAVDIEDLFAPPKLDAPVVTKVPEPQPEVKLPDVVAKPAEAPLPDLRLVGFTEMEGLQALLAVDGQLNAMGVGDVVRGVQLVAMAPPVVTLKHEDHEFEMDLTKQPWSSLRAELPGVKGTDRKLPRLPTAGPGKRGLVPPSRNNPPTPRLPDTNAARLAPAMAPATTTTAAPMPSLPPPSLPVVPPPKLPRSPSSK